MRQRRRTSAQVADSENHPISHDEFCERIAALAQSAVQEVKQIHQGSFIDDSFYAQSSTKPHGGGAKRRTSGGFLGGALPRPSSSSSLQRAAPDTPGSKASSSAGSKAREFERLRELGILARPGSAGSNNNSSFGSGRKDAKAGVVASSPSPITLPDYDNDDAVHSSRGGEQQEEASGKRGSSPISTAAAMVAASLLKSPQLSPTGSHGRATSPSLASPIHRGTTTSGIFDRLPFSPSIIQVQNEVATPPSKKKVNQQQGLSSSNANVSRVLSSQLQLQNIRVIGGEDETKGESAFVPYLRDDEDEEEEDDDVDWSSDDDQETAKRNKKTASRRVPLRGASAVMARSIRDSTKTSFRILCKAFTGRLDLNLLSIARADEMCYEAMRSVAQQCSAATDAAAIRNSDVSSDLASAGGVLPNEEFHDFASRNALREALVEKTSNRFHLVDTRAYECASEGAMKFKLRRGFFHGGVDLKPELHVALTFSPIVVEETFDKSFFLPSDKAAPARLRAVLVGTMRYDDDVQHDHFGVEQVESPLAAPLQKKIRNKKLKKLAAAQDAALRREKAAGTSSSATTTSSRHHHHHSHGTTCAGAFHPKKNLCTVNLLQEYQQERRKQLREKFYRNSGIGNGQGRSNAVRQLEEARQRQSEAERRVEELKRKRASVLLSATSLSPAALGGDAAAGASAEALDATPPRASVASFGSAPSPSKVVTADLTAEEEAELAEDLARSPEPSVEAKELSPGATTPAFHAGAGRRSRRTAAAAATSSPSRGGGGGGDGADDSESRGLTDDEMMRDFLRVRKLRDDLHDLLEEKKHEDATPLRPRTGGLAAVQERIPDFVPYSHCLVRPEYIVVYEVANTDPADERKVAKFIMAAGLGRSRRGKTKAQENFSPYDFTARFSVPISRLRENIQDDCWVRHCVVFPEQLFSHATGRPEDDVQRDKDVCGADADSGGGGDGDEGNAKQRGFKELPLPTLMSLFEKGSGAIDLVDKHNVLHCRHSFTFTDDFLASP